MFVERRTCFKSGEFGHIIKSCTNTPREKFVEKDPPEKVHPQRRPVSPKHDK
ncbi:putative transcription factor interactor and regulator CCHC(Zn) family [Helianthus anomalus]